MIGLENNLPQDNANYIKDRYVYDGDGMLVLWVEQKGPASNVWNIKRTIRLGSFEIVMNASNLNPGTVPNPQPASKNGNDTYSTTMAYPTIGNTYVMWKCYYGGLAMRVQTNMTTGVDYLLTDHLGSVYKVIGQGDGGLVSENRYGVWGNITYTFGDPTYSTNKTYTGQDASGNSGLIFYQSRWYDPCIMRWLTPDTVIADPYNPMDLDRYAYVRNNPVNFNDPTGHWPEWWDWIQGAVFQYANDMTGGAVGNIALYYGVCMDCNASAAYAEGQQAGRTASTTVATVEEVTGAATTAAALAAMPSTAGGGLVCAAVTAGLCALPAGGAVLAEGAIAAGGVAIAGSGAATMGYIRANSVQGPSYTASNFRKNLENRTPIPNGLRNPEAHHVLPQALESQFSRLGININEPQWGTWVEGGGPHQQWSHAYQVEWESWLQNNPNATLSDVRTQAGNLAQQFGYTWP